MELCYACYVFDLMPCVSLVHDLCMDPHNRLFYMTGEGTERWKPELEKSGC